jgi:hypothetical protein
VLIWGSGNTIANNTITGNQACSLAYGRDGSAVEIYGGSGNIITGKTASNDNAITELGSYVDGGGNTFIGTCNPSSGCPYAPKATRAHRWTDEFCPPGRFTCEHLHQAGPERGECSDGLQTRAHRAAGGRCRQGQDLLYR